MATDELKLTRDKWDSEYSNHKWEINVDTDLEPELRDSYKYINKYLDEKGYFLEAGCGFARNSYLLSKERGQIVIGIDISSIVLRRAKKFFDETGVNGHFILGDVLHMPFKEDIFSTIYAGGTIEHFKDTLHSVKEMRRCLKRNGRLLATVPCASLSLPYLLLRGNIPELPLLRPIFEFLHIRILRGKLLKHGYEKSFTTGKILNIFREAGFNTIEFGLFETHYSLRPIKIDFIKNIMRKIAKNRLFWPMIYVNSVK